jgi:V8-like Glu-specific endopeptidase
MEETSIIQPSIDELKETYSHEQLRTELKARRFQTEALQNRLEDLKHIPNDLLIEALVHSPQVIYGPDNRIDLYQVKDQRILNLAKGIVLVVRAENLVKQKDGSYNLITFTFEEVLKPCLGHPFTNQPTGGFGTGFFITPSCIATAGHVLDGKNIQNLRFISGYRMLDFDTPIANFKPNQIFSIAQVIRSRYTRIGQADYAIVQVTCLDGKTQGFPLPISPTTVFRNESVYIMGHPSGLPIKYAPNSVVRDILQKSYFVANLDTIGGNSGSPVFDVNNTVIGILVNGEEDWDWDWYRNCNQERECPTTDCVGESVQRISGVVGPITDLSLELQIGSNGIYTDRHVYARLKENNLYPFIQLPLTYFYPYQSYTFSINPDEMGISCIDDIDYIEIQSPSTNAWDSWELARVIIKVNGNQELHNIAAYHTFGTDGQYDPSQLWEKKLSVLQDRYTLASVHLGYGSTPPRNTNWKSYNPNSLSLYVDTSTANFSSTPLYFASLGGDAFNWEAKGISAIYDATATGFTIYLDCEQKFTPEDANKHKWHVNWTGIESNA